MKPDVYLNAARVPLTLQPQTFRDWTIVRINEDSKHYRLMQKVCAGFPCRTILYKMTLEKMNHEHGDVVMEDSSHELSRHLPIWMKGRGRILVTGLGLGCVVRGLLANPDVEHIDCVELDRDILRIVGAEFEGNPRVTLRRGDALKYRWPDDVRWDYAWHDLYFDGDNLKLAEAHTELMFALRPKIKRAQGAWAFPARTCKRMLGDWYLR